LTENHSYSVIELVPYHTKYYYKFIGCFCIEIVCWNNKSHSVWLIYGRFITRHSLVSAKGEVFVLLYVFCSVNDFSTTRGPIHTKVCIWFRMCLLPFWRLASPGRRKKGVMKFLFLWESMGNFCILVVFERYLSNAWTDPHQILFV